MGGGHLVIRTSQQQGFFEELLMSNSHSHSLSHSNSHSGNARMQAEIVFTSASCEMLTYRNVKSVGQSLQPLVTSSDSEPSEHVILLL